MKTVSCPSCGKKMVKNGTTSSGKQRWRCSRCGVPQIIRYDDTASRLDELLKRLLSKGTQRDMPGQGRAFRRRTSEFWHICPMPDATGEAHRAIYVDGMYLSRKLVVLIASTDEHVLAWYMAQEETSRAWEALPSPIPAPDVAVADGGPGFAKAARRVWPNTRVQRRVFHAFCQVRRCTTTRPRLLAGKELYALAIDLLRIEALRQADLRAERLLQRCGFWADLLEEKGFIDGKYVFAHGCLGKARASLARLVSQGTLFAYLDLELTKEGPLPATNNRCVLSIASERNGHRELGSSLTGSGHGN